MNAVPAPVNETDEPPALSLVKTDNESYTIPLRYRKMENLHILFWLFKDISWCLVWRPLGMMMIIPTLFISIVIAWRTRNYVSELCHNLAISVWIAANSYWMISEFFGFDEKIVTGNITYKHLSMIPFTIGVLILMYYYLYFKMRYKSQADTM
jgi:hypothetical protein